MVWSVNVEANVLAADPLSPYMAVVDNDQKCKYNICTRINEKCSLVQGC